MIPFKYGSIVTGKDFCGRKKFKKAVKRIYKIITKVCNYLENEE